MSFPRPSFYQGFARNAAQSAAPDQWQGLIGAWAPFLGNQGTTVYDWSGRNHPGTLTNMTPATDWVITSMGPGLTFDGSVDYVTFASGTFPAMYTVAAWVRRNAALSDDAGIFSVVTGRNLHIRSTTGNYRFWDGGTIRSFGDLISVLGAIEHVVVTYDGVTMRAYRNGVASTTTAAPAASAVAYTTGYIGAVSPTADRFPCTILEVRWYDWALPHSMIMEIYKDPYTMYRLKRRFPGALAAAVAPNIGSLALTGVGR